MAGRQSGQEAKWTGGKSGMQNGREAEEWEAEEGEAKKWEAKEWEAKEWEAKEWEAKLSGSK